MNESKLSTISVRVSMWIVAWFGLSVWMIYDAIATSKANMVNDPSSMAWVGFLPFIAPLFLLQGGAFVLPTAIVVETGLFIRRWRKRCETLETETKSVE